MAEQLNFQVREEPLTSIALVTSDSIEMWVDVCFFYVTDIVAASLESQIVFVFNIDQLHKAKAFTPAASFRHLGRFTLAQGLLERSFASSINKELDLLC